MALVRWGTFLVVFIVGSLLNGLVLYLVVFKSNNSFFYDNKLSPTVSIDHKTTIKQTPQIDQQTTLDIMAKTGRINDSLFGESLLKKENHLRRSDDDDHHRLLLFIHIDSSATPIGFEQRIRARNTYLKFADPKWVSYRFFINGLLSKKSTSNLAINSIRKEQQKIRLKYGYSDVVLSNDQNIDIGRNKETIPYVQWNILWLEHFLSLTKKFQYYLKIADDGFLCLPQLLSELLFRPIFKQQSTNKIKEEKEKEDDYIGKDEEDDENDNDEEKEEKEEEEENEPLFWGKFWCENSVSVRPEEYFNLFSIHVIHFLINDWQSAKSLLPYHRQRTFSQNFGYYANFLNISLLDDRKRLLGRRDIIQSSSSDQNRRKLSAFKNSMIENSNARKVDDQNHTVDDIVVDEVESSMNHIRDNDNTSVHMFDASKTLDIVNQIEQVIKDQNALKSHIKVKAQNIIINPQSPEYNFCTSKIFKYKLSYQIQQSKKLTQFDQNEIGHTMYEGLFNTIQRLMKEDGRSWSPTEHTIDNVINETSRISDNEQEEELNFNSSRYGDQDRYHELSYGLLSQLYAKSMHQPETSSPFQPPCSHASSSNGRNIYFSQFGANHKTSTVAFIDSTETSSSADKIEASTSSVSFRNNDYLNPFKQNQFLNLKKPFDDVPASDHISTNNQQMRNINPSTVVSRNINPQSKQLNPSLTYDSPRKKQSIDLNSKHATTIPTNNKKKPIMMMEEKDDPESAEAVAIRKFQQTLGLVAGSQGLTPAGAAAKTNLAVDQVLDRLGINAQGTAAERLALAAIATASPAGQKVIRNKKVVSTTQYDRSQSVHGGGGVDKELNEHIVDHSRRGPIKNAKIQKFADFAPQREAGALNVIDAVRAATGTDVQ